MYVYVRVRECERACVCGWGGGAYLPMTSIPLSGLERRMLLAARLSSSRDGDRHSVENLSAWSDGRFQRGTHFTECCRRQPPRLQPEWQHLTSKYYITYFTFTYFYSLVGVPVSPPCLKHLLYYLRTGPTSPIQLHGSGSRG